MRRGGINDSISSSNRRGVCHSRREASDLAERDREKEKRILKRKKVKKFKTHRRELAFPFLSLRCPARRGLAPAPRGETTTSDGAIGGAGPASEEEEEEEAATATGAGGETMMTSVVGGAGAGAALAIALGRGTATTVATAGTAAAPGRAAGTEKR